MSRHGAFGQCVMGDVVYAFEPQRREEREGGFSCWVILILEEGFSIKIPKPFGRKTYMHEHRALGTWIGFCNVIQKWELRATPFRYCINRGNFI